MNIEYHTDHYINYAKFLQNLFWENNIECYLIGGSLINAVRDNGVFKSDDIDFAIIANENYKNLNSILDLISANSPTFSWHLNFAVLSIYFNLNSFEKNTTINIAMISRAITDPEVKQKFNSWANGYDFAVIDFK